MTVSTTNSSTLLTADGNTTLFPFTYAIQLATDMQVSLNGAIVTTGFTININPSGVGGSVTFTAAPANGVLVLMNRIVPFTQTTTLPTEGNLPEQTIVNMVDRVVMMVQGLATLVNRAITLSLISSANPNLTIPTPQANAVIGWDATGQNLVNLTNGVGPVGATGAQGPAGAAGPGSGLFKAQGIATSSPRALPTSGALSGTYIHLGNWTQTGNITFAHGTRIYVNGSFTTLAGSTFTGTAQSNGGISLGLGILGGNGGGMGGGFGGIYPYGGGSGGGGFAAGGTGGILASNKKQSGGIGNSTLMIGGSGGGSGSGAGTGTKFGAAGGGGGPALYIEVNGNVSIQESMTANGAAGTNASAATGGAGAGGAGGQIIIRNIGTFLLAAGKSISCNGGAGGNFSGSGGPGGGGAGGYVEISSSGTITLTGTITVTAGAAGTTTASFKSAPAAGSAGSSVTFPGMAPSPASL